jgi:hypothetical protein
VQLVVGEGGRAEGALVGIVEVAAGVAAAVKDAEAAFHKNPGVAELEQERGRYSGAGQVATNIALDVGS